MEQVLSKYILTTCLCQAAYPFEVTTKKALQNEHYKRKRKLPSLTAAKDSWKAGTLIDISFQDIFLLWMNAGIHEAGKWRQLPAQPGNSQNE